jgi:hypothetical protein
VYTGLVDTTGYQLECERIQRDFVEGDAVMVSRRAGASELEAFQTACAQREEAFVDQYRAVIDQVTDGTIRLPGMWKRKTADLGDRVFAGTLAERRSRR